MAAFDGIYKNYKDEFYRTINISKGPNEDENGVMVGQIKRGTEVRGWRLI